MKKIITTTIFSFFMLGSVSVQAASLTGAFGYNVGEKVNTAQLQPLQEDSISGAESANTNLQIYKLIPLDQNTTFNTYTATVEKSTSKLISIQANNSLGSLQACMDNLAKVSAPLAKQYGSNTKLNNPKLFYVMDSSTNNTLNLGCSETGDLNLSISHLGQ